MRNAIHALQEMTTPSSIVGSGHCAAHSNPNITRIPHSSSGTGMIARSTSHPPEMFCWEEPTTPHHIISYVDREIQTDFDIIQNIVIENPRRVLEILGLDPDIIFSILNKNDKIKMNDDLQEKKDEWKACPFFWESSDISNKKNGSKLYEAINQNVDSNIIKLRKSPDEDS